MINQDVLLLTLLPRVAQPQALSPNNYTGFDPGAAGVAAQPERLNGALYVVWDEATLPPLPSHISPWEVVEDTARKSRQVERSRAEALAQARKVPFNTLWPFLKRLQSIAQSWGCTWRHCPAAHWLKESEL